MTSVLQCATVSDMSIKISVRLSDDVLQAVDEAARQQDRNRSQVINRVLRAALDVNQNENWKDVAGVVPAKVKIVQRPTEPQTETYTPREPEKISEKPRFRKCQHGGNEFTCGRTACKIKTGRG